MKIPWPQVDSGSALIFGALGLVVAWLSYRAFVRSHDSQLRLEAMTLAEATRSILEDLALERPDLLKWFQSQYASKGQFLSGAMEVKRREFDGFAATIDRLRGELAAASTGSDRLSGRKLERRVVEVRAIHMRAYAMKGKFNQYHQELREDADEHWANTLAAFGAKQRSKKDG